jgi:hypothetical protein
MHLVRTILDDIDEHLREASKRKCYSWFVAISIGLGRASN